jgi:AcrR family transcriptional regulator
MRDLSRASGMSLAGLYYYFESKERLLFLIQKHTFQHHRAAAQSAIGRRDDPEQRIRIFILNHLEYFLANPAAMKVLSHEAEALEERIRLRSWQPSSASTTGFASDCSTT